MKKRILILLIVLAVFAVYLVPVLAEDVPSEQKPKTTPPTTPPTTVPTTPPTTVPTTPPTTVPTTPSDLVAVTLPAELPTNPPTTVSTTPPTTVPTAPPPSAQYGTIYASSSPEGASIYLNGYFNGYAPLTIPDLFPGSYTIKAALDGYTSDTQTLSVYTGQTTGYYPVLQNSPQPPSHETGNIYVTSDPTKAHVTVDSIYKGLTPLTIALYPGYHDVVVSLSGYNDGTKTVYITVGTTQEIFFPLTTGTYGSVTIGSAPAGAIVYMDSNQQGKTDAAGSFTMTGIVSGNHLFKVKAIGYYDWINTIYVKPNENTNIPVIMTPIGPDPTPAPAPASGSLQITSSPSGADVFVDNLFRGYTPVTVPDLSAGQHPVLLKRAGFVDYRTTVQVNSGQTTTLAATMSPVPIPTPTTDPSTALLVGGLVALAGISAAYRRRY